MSYKKKHQVTGKLITSGLRSRFSEMSTSPTTPLEVKILSHTGLIDCEMSGIGLGIVAALENSRVNIPAKKSNFRCRNPMEEDYTITTSHKTEKSCRKAHCVTRKLIEIRDRDRPSIFDISPTRSGDDDMKRCTALKSLSSCHLCNKKLHGKDIYMYREKPFCGPECRSRQIGMDERREKHCNSQASSSSNDISPNVLPTGIFAI